jgi:hypothetical protein
VRPAAAAALLALAALPPAVAGDIPGAVIVLEAAPGTPGSDPSGAPPRFVLLKDGQVFVGGTARLEAGRLEKGEVSALLKRAEAVRKLPGLSPAPARGSAPGTASPVSLGGDPARTLRLRILDAKPLDVVATGDPAQAPPALAPLGTLVADLLRFNHPSLRPYAPASYAMTVREARLVGGCRAWGFPFPITEALASARTVSAAEAAGWPTGARPASVCGDDAGPSASAGRRYVVTLRPLLPGERP